MSLCNKIFLHFLSLKIFGRKLKLIINLKKCRTKIGLKFGPKTCKLKTYLAFLCFKKGQNQNRVEDRWVADLSDPRAGEEVQQGKITKM